MAETYTDYPKAATTNAKRAVDWAEENGWGTCGTAVGKARAHQLANREPISFDTVKRMAKYKRHQQHKDVPYDEGCGGLMWDAWGGEQGIDWAIKKVEQVEKEKENMKEVTIDGAIGKGFDMWSGEEMVSMNVVKDQFEDATDIRLVLNSPGGSVIEGFAIADYLRKHGEKNAVEIVGTGIVGSIATMIFASGSKGKRLLTPNAFFMIHNASSGVGGTKEEMRKEAELLEMMDGQIMSNYIDLIESNGKLVNGSREETEEQLKAWMDEEKWFTAREAVSVGLADGIASGDYETEEVQQNMVAMAKRIKRAPSAFINYINTIQMENELSKEEQTQANGLWNAIKSFFVGQSNSAQAMEEEKEEEETTAEYKKEEEDMEKEEMMSQLEAMKKELDALKKSMMEEEKEEEKEEEATNEAEAHKAEIARLKAQLKKQERGEKSNKMETTTKSRREEMLEKVVNRSGGFLTELSDRIGDRI